MSTGLAMIKDNRQLHEVKDVLELLGVKVVLSCTEIKQDPVLNDDVVEKEIIHHDETGVSGDGGNAEVKFENIVKLENTEDDMKAVEEIQKRKEILAEILDDVDGEDYGKDKRNAADADAQTQSCVGSLCNQNNFGWRKMERAEAIHEVTMEVLETDHEAVVHDGEAKETLVTETEEKPRTAEEKRSQIRRTEKKTTKRKDSTKKHDCPQCNYSTDNRSNIIEHVRTHTGDKPFKCMLCDYAAAQNSTLKEHMKRHTGQKPYKCTSCDYAAAKKQTRDLHMLKRHGSETPHQGKDGIRKHDCPQCNYSTDNRSLLIIHARTHTGDKPFKCMLCGYSAAQKGTLKEHMKRHTGQKPYKCTSCHYAAAKKQTLNLHMLKRHEGETPHQL